MISDGFYILPVFKSVPGIILERSPSVRCRQMPQPFLFPVWHGRSDNGRDFCLASWKAGWHTKPPVFHHAARNLHRGPQSPNSLCAVLPLTWGDEGPVCCTRAPTPQSFQPNTPKSACTHAHVLACIHAHTHTLYRAWISDTTNKLTMETRDVFYIREMCLNLNDLNDTGIFRLSCCITLGLQLIIILIIS